jgi:hypothetical protein
MADFLSLLAKCYEGKEEDRKENNEQRRTRLGVPGPNSFAEIPGVHLPRFPIFPVFGCGVAMWFVGSNPARHPSLGSAQENLGAGKLIFPSAAAGDTSAAAGMSPRHQGRILYQYCRQKIKNKWKKGHEIFL